jgi:hypothetical protein
MTSYTFFYQFSLTLHPRRPLFAYNTVKEAYRFMKNFFSFCALTLLGLAAVTRASDTKHDTQTIAIERGLQIPGAVLTAAQYTISVEDRMRGRAIVRIENVATGEHHLLLTIPNAKLTANTAGQLVFFTNADTGTQILRAWSCPSCDQPLEMVYPKAEAVQITADAGQSVMAADPAYDHLPANLSADDMKVVTLWLLSPERISNHHGIGVKAAHYVSPNHASPANSFADNGIEHLCRCLRSSCGLS